MKTIITVCGWCERVQQPTGQWAVMPETKRAIERSRCATHGICKDCDAKQRAELAELKAKRS